MKDPWGALVRSAVTLTICVIAWLLMLTVFVLTGKWYYLVCAAVNGFCGYSMYRSLKRVKALLWEFVGFCAKQGAEEGLRRAYEHIGSCEHCQRALVARAPIDPAHLN